MPSALKTDAILNRQLGRMSHYAWDSWNKDLSSEFLTSVREKKQTKPAVSPPVHDHLWENREKEKDRKAHEEYEARGWDHIRLTEDGFKEVNKLVTEDKAISKANRWDISEVALKRMAFHFQNFTYYFSVISSNMVHLRIWVDIPDEDGGGTFETEYDLQFFPHGVKLRYPKDGNRDMYEFLVSEDGDSGVRNFETTALMFDTLNTFMLHYGEIAFNVREIVCKKPSKKRAAPAANTGHKVRLIKSYTLKKNWKTKVERKKAEIRCLAWGVRGHFRHYKDGRVVFVHPYVKGKERDKYVGRDYVLLPKEQKKEEESK